MSGVSPNYVSKDKRDSEYKRAFGKYLIKERYGREITFVAMARALGINRNTYCAWENGSAWPQEVMTLAILDRLYGNTFDVLFDLCEKNGIKLSMAESKDVLKKIKVFEGTKRGQRGNGWFREELAA